MSTPSVIKDQDGEEIATFYAEDRTPVELDEISTTWLTRSSPLKMNAFMNTAAWTDKVCSRGGTQHCFGYPTGRSTLTQQYVNNVLVNYQNLIGS